MKKTHMLIYYLLFIIGMPFIFTKNVLAEDLGANTCTNDGSCMLLCSYQNNFSGIIRNINIYYHKNGNWAVTWDFGSIDTNKMKGPSSFNQVFSKSSTNIYLTTGTTADDFKCPRNAYFDRNAYTEICFDDDGETCERDYSDHTWFSTRFGQWDNDFNLGSEVIDYDIYNDIDLYYSRSNSILGDITCDDIANGKYDPNNRQDVSDDIIKDFQINFLHNTAAPYFLQDYIYSDDRVEKAKNALQEKQAQCIAENEDKYSTGQYDENEYSRRKNIFNGFNFSTFAENVKNANQNIKFESKEEIGNANNVLIGNVEGMDICSQNGVKNVLHVIGYLIFAVKIAVPLLLVIMGSIDFAQALMASDDKAMKDATAKLVKRVIAGIIVFFIPTILNFFLGLVDGISDNQTHFTGCSSCLFTPFDGSCTYTKIGE